MVPGSEAVVCRRGRRGGGARRGGRGRAGQERRWKSEERQVERERERRGRRERKREREREREREKREGEEVRRRERGNCELASDVAFPFLGFTSFIRRTPGSSRGRTPDSAVLETYQKRKLALLRMQRLKMLVLVFTGRKSGGGGGK